MMEADWVTASEICCMPATVSVTTSRPLLAVCTVSCAIVAARPEFWATCPTVAFISSTAVAVCVGQLVHPVQDPPDRIEQPPGQREREQNRADQHQHEREHGGHQHSAHPRLRL